ncbi:hypothetical protein [Edaphobacter sp.]|uniref:hypothetical protein n=1 Tax=Edaphobacter sp. TaxID=1934404 RepID=UPI002DBAEC17|nr:hypothetical protein [Edaphobacter sp.]HEU5340734.1 hypothetical protein [Edaphobacter sp.]
MFFRARRALGRAWFNFNCRSLLETSPLLPNDDRLTLVSMVCHGEALMYLLAAKSFCRRLGRNPNVVLLDDGSLTKEDKALLRAHLPKVRIVHISEVTPDRCPKGSCWERLLLISDVVKDSYVVQLDSDTLTLGPIDVVIECIDRNRSFTLMGDRSFPEIEPMLSACARSKDLSSAMVQAVCERSFDQLPEAASLKYVRGNAGFTGFARGSIDREKIGWFSDLMRRIAKEKWDEWGSEQVTSNLLMANTPDALPLTFPKYLSYWAHPDVPYEDASFIHFIGPHRFSNGFYLRSAKKIIAALKNDTGR